MSVTIVGNNTPTAGGVVYGDGTNYASTAAGTSGQVLQSNGASAPTWVAAPATSPAGSTGQVQYNNAGAFGAVSSGTSGQVLTSAGTGAAPTWTTPSAGAMTLISSTSLSTTASVSITNLNFSTYKTYVIYLTSVINDTSTATAMRVSTDNGSTWKTTNYSTSYATAAASAITAAVGPTTYFQINAAGYSLAYPNQAVIYLPSPVPATASGFAQFYYSGMNSNSSAPNNGVANFGSGINTAGYGQYNAVQLYPVSGNFTSGYINVYGVT